MSAWPNPYAWHYGQTQHPHVYVPPSPYTTLTPNVFWNQPGWQPNTPRYHADNYRSRRYPSLNPLLAIDCKLPHFDAREKPSDSIESTILTTGKTSPATELPASHIRLYSKAFPWTVEIVVPAGSIITCYDIWHAIYAVLREPIADSEWGMIMNDDTQQQAILRAAKKRQADGQGGKQLLRIDWLGNKTVFKGLEKDEDFEKMRLLPGGELKPCAETWIVQFGRQ